MVAWDAVESSNRGRDEDSVGEGGRRLLSVTE